MNLKLEDCLIRARLERPYYAVALAALRPVMSDLLPTAAVDRSWRLYINPEWLENHTVEEVAKVIACHEVEHLLRDHHGRRGPRDAHAWNICGDAEINDDEPFLIQLTGVSPAALGQPDGLLAEQYYESLEKHPPTSCQCGSGAGGEAGKWELPDDGGGVTEVQAEQIRDTVASEVRASPPGTVPAGIQVWADARAKAMEVPWPRILSAAVRKGMAVVPGRADYDMRRPGRRQREDHPLRPRSVAFRPKVGLVIDTSGSVDGGQALGVVKALVRQLGTPSVCIDCDMEAHVTRAKGARVGGGGTDMRVGIKAAYARGARVVIVVTDGYTPWPEPVQGATIVAVLVGDQPPETPPHLVRVVAR